jgi:hypothetical protein
MNTLNCHTCQYPKVTFEKNEILRTYLGGMAGRANCAKRCQKGMAKSATWKDVP